MTLMRTSIERESLRDGSNNDEGVEDSQKAKKLPRDYRAASNLSNPLPSFVFTATGSVEAHGGDRCGWPPLPHLPNRMNNLQVSTDSCLT